MQKKTTTSQGWKEQETAYGKEHYDSTNYVQTLLFEGAILHSCGSNCENNCVAFDVSTADYLKIMSSGMWHRVTGLAFPNILNEGHVFIFSGSEVPRPSNHINYKL